MKEKAKRKVQLYTKAEMPGTQKSFRPSLLWRFRGTSCRKSACKGVKELNEQGNGKLDGCVCPVVDAPLELTHAVCI